MFYSELIFDRFYHHNQTILARITYSTLDHQDKLNSVNDIWACLSNTLDLKFLFPIHTKSVGFANAGDCLVYTTHTDTGGGNWYNTGIIDSEGGILYPAQNRSVIGMTNNQFTVFEWIGDEEDLNETTLIKVSVGTIQEPKLLNTRIFCVPSEITTELFQLGADRQFQSSISSSDINDYIDALLLLLNNDDLYNVKKTLKRLTRSKNKLVKDCARQNLHSVEKLFIRGTILSGCHI